MAILAMALRAEIRGEGRLLAHRQPIASKSKVKPFSCPDKENGFLS